MNEEQSGSTLDSLAKYIESSSTEVSSDEVNQSSTQEIQPKTNASNYKLLNFEADYLRALASSNDHNTGGLIFKRPPLDLDPVERGTLEIGRREISDSFMGGNYLMRPDMRNMMVYEEDASKLGIYKTLKREEYDFNSSVDLMNFN